MTKHKNLELERLIIQKRMEKHTNKGMKKSIKALVGTVLIGGTFFFGTYVQAETDFLTLITSEANKEIGKAAHDKKEEIIADIEENAKAQVKEQIQPEIDEKSKEAKEILQNYADEKLSNVVEEVGMDKIEQKMEEKKINVTDRYKDAIDEAIQGAF